MTFLMAALAKPGVSSLRSCMDLKLLWNRCIGCAVAAVLVSGPCAIAQPVVLMPLLAAPPYAWLDSQGQPQGLYPDIAAALARVTGLNIRIEVVPFARAATQVVNGAADATLMLTNTFTAGKTIQAVPVFYATVSVQLRPGLAVAGRSDLIPLRLGRMNGGCAELAEEAHGKLHFADLNSHESGVQMLAAGRLDGFCSVSEATVDALRSTGLQDRFEKAQVVALASKPVWLMLSPKVAPDVAKRLEAGVRQLQSNGELAGIFKARLGPGYKLRTTP